MYSQSQRISLTVLRGLTGNHDSLLNVPGSGSHIPRLAELSLTQFVDEIRQNQSDALAEFLTHELASDSQSHPAKSVLLFLPTTSLVEINLPT